MPSNTSSNKAVVPEAKGALDRFKYEVANELGVPLTAVSYTHLTLPTTPYV